MTITDARYTIGRAYPKTQRRPGGWFNWYCITYLGEEVGESGMERTKGVAMKAAQAEAVRLNTLLPRSESRHLKFDRRKQISVPAHS